VQATAGLDEVAAEAGLGGLRMAGECNPGAPDRMVSSGTHGGPHTPNRLLAAAIGLVVAVAYLPTLRAGLVWDDTTYVLAQGGRHVAGALVGDLIAGSNPAHGPVATTGGAGGDLWLGARLAPDAVAPPRAGDHLPRPSPPRLLFALLAVRLGGNAEAPAAVGALAWALHPRQRGAGGLGLPGYDLLAGSSRWHSWSALAPRLAAAAAVRPPLPGRLLSKGGSALVPVVWSTTSVPARRARGPARGSPWSSRRRPDRAPRRPGNRCRGPGAAREPAATTSRRWRRTLFRAVAPLPLT